MLRKKNEIILPFSQEALPGPATSGPSTPKFSFNEMAQYVFQIYYCLWAWPYFFQKGAGSRSQSYQAL
jgi:hypothetical protein